MIVFIITILFLQIIFSTTENLSNIRYSSLLSAQCKARCLYEYRNQHHHQQYQSISAAFIHGKTKRLLTTNTLTLPWRSIWERCPRLITCSSCLLPCDLDPPLLLSNEFTCQAICSTLKNVECQRSCIFIKKLYEQQSNFSETIAQPYNITANERKSRRTVRLKWNLNKMIHTEPVFYVIEAQWTLPKTDELVSKWGFVKEEVSHTKAIIRNIQRDYRWYTFRIAAVTRHGYSLYSIPTKPFRLTNQSENLSSIIEPPRNFSIKDFQLNSETMNITVTWQQADFPINGYQITWEYENDQSSLVNSINVSSSLSSLEFTIPFLSIYKSYLFKIRSIVITQGNSIQMSLPILINFNSEDELFRIKNLQISKSYFQNGLIKMNISWNKINNSRIKQYDLYWIENECYSDIYSCCYRRDAVTIKNYFQLYDLRFNCTYLLNIIPIGFQFKKSFQFYFNVSSCELVEVYGSIRPPCQTTDRKTIDIFSSLPPLDLIVTRNKSGLNFNWQTVHSSINGIVYRLRIEQLPNHVEIISHDLSPMITNYFLPYSKSEDNRHLNVTISLVDNIIIRQQQTILVSDPREAYLYDQFNINSSSTSVVVIYYLYLFYLFYLTIN